MFVSGNKTDMFAPPISVIKHLHMLLKHTLTQRNGQQNKLGNSSSTTYTGTCKPLKTFTIS